MTSFEHNGVTIAIVATPKSPVGETGGGEVFTGALANALAEQGFPVRIYGQENPNFGFAEGVTYVETSPTTDEIMANDKVGIRKAVNETGVAAPLRLAMDIAAAPHNQPWAIIDNDTTSAPLVPLTSSRFPHIFVQHSRMTSHASRIYSRIKASGGKIVAIADHQRADVTTQFGPLHDVTIKNGISTTDFTGIQPRHYEPGQPIHVGTLSRIEPTDMKGVKIAALAVEKLRQRHDAFLTLAGPVLDRATHEALVAPSLGDAVEYAGVKRGAEKAEYLSSLHVGAALSNPGGWDEPARRFTSWFAEGNSLTLHEMIYAGTVPVSTDSGGAEPMKDAGLSDFIVPLDLLPKIGMDAFTELTAQKMLEAAYAVIDPAELRSKARTMEAVGKDYASYIMQQLDVQRTAL